MTKMYIDRATVEQALEALEFENSWHDIFKIRPYTSTIDAVAALRTTLAQQDEPVEPVGWLQPKTVDAHSRPDLGYETCSKDDYGAFPVYTTPPKAEPVAWNWMLDGYPYGQMYYGNPPDADILERAATTGRTVRLLYATPPKTEPVAWRTFDGEGGYEYRSYEDNEGYADAWARRNPNHVGWVEALYTPLPKTEPVAWMYKGEPWFDGTRYHDQYEVTTDERLARFKDENARPLYFAP